VNDIIYDIVISTAQGGVALREKGLSEIQDLTPREPSRLDSRLDPIKFIYLFCFLVTLVLYILIKIMRQ